MSRPRRGRPFNARNRGDCLSQEGSKPAEPAGSNNLATALVSLEEALAALISERDEQFDHVARVLHDDLGQTLTGVGMQMEAMRLDFQDRVPEIAGSVVALQQTLEELMQRIRELSHELNPSIVDRIGLPFAMERVVAKCRRASRGINVRLFFEPSVKIDREPARGVYRIAECALDHAIRHTHCTQIEVRIRPVEHGAELEVRHDGIITAGEMDADSGGRLGLLLLHYHAKRAGIPVAIESDAQRGTMIKAIIGF